MNKPTSEAKQPKFSDLTKTSFKFFPFLSQTQAYIVLTLIGIIFNITSLHNEYALDDGIIIHQNDYVLKGTAGIKEILIKDAYDSFYRRMHATDQLAGGRYRPLSVVSFAMEQEYIGHYPTGNYAAYEDKNMNGTIDRNKDPYKCEYNKWVDKNSNNVVEANECVQCWDKNDNGVPDVDSEDINGDGIVNEIDCQVLDASLRHGINIITYVLGVLLLYLFLSTCIFKDNHDLAFLSALLFLMHPMHTEVIANVKSRDEIFSLIFISMTLFFSFRYSDYQNYFGKPSFSTTGSSETKKILFIGVVAAVAFFLYILRNSGIEIMLPSLIISGLIIFRSYQSFLKHKQYTKNDLLIWASISFFFALLSKEYAITLLVLIPAMVYIFTKHEFNIIPFLKALGGVAVAGFGGILIMKSKSPDHVDQKILFMAAGVVAIIAGLAFSIKFFKEFKNIFIVLFTFIISAVGMLTIKYLSDVSTVPNHKPDLSFWILPFVFLIFGIFVIGKTYKQNNFNTLMSWLFFVTLIYLGMRLLAVKLKPGVPDTELLNNPYLLANSQEIWSSKFYVLLKYLSLLFFPHPLSSDYSYNTIEYRHFTSWDFIFSVVIHIALAGLAFYLFLKKHIVGFALLVYFAFLMMIGNILMDIGATMGERLIFHSSIGFTIAVAWLILKGLEKLSAISINVRKIALILLVGGVGFLYGCKYWERNWDWKNDITLFIKDANTVPNSVLVLGNAGARWVDLADTKFFNSKPEDGIEPPFSTYKDEMLGITISDEEFKNGLTRDNVVSLNPNGEANKQGLTKRQLSLYKGIGYLKHATSLHPRYVNGYLNLGLAYYKLKRDREALFFWKHAERLYPNNPYLKNYYIVMYNDLLNRGYQKAQRGQLDSAIFELNKCLILDRLNPEGWYNIGGAFYQKKEYGKAKQYWEECLKINPNHEKAKQGLSTIITTTVPVATPVKK